MSESGSIRNARDAPVFDKVLIADKTGLSKFEALPSKLGEGLNPFLGFTSTPLHHLRPKARPHRRKCTVA